MRGEVSPVRCIWDPILGEGKFVGGQRCERTMVVTLAVSLTIRNFLSNVPDAQINMGDRGGHFGA